MIQKNEIQSLNIYAPMFSFTKENGKVENMFSRCNRNNSTFPETTGKVFTLVLEYNVLEMYYYFHTC